jgi:hypothetical protein
MYCTGFRVLAVSAALLLSGAVQARIQTAGPTPPKRSVTTKIIRSRSVSTAVPVHKAVTDALVRLNPSDRRNAEITGRYTQVLNSRFLSSLPEKRQDIDLVDVPLKEALKRVLEDSKTPYVIDDDVPNEPKITIKLTNAPLTTILDALTLSNGIGWRTEFKQSTTVETSNPAAKEEKSKSGAARSDYLPILSAGNRYVTTIHVGKTVAKLPDSIQFRTLNIPGPPTSPLPDVYRGAFPPPTPQLQVYRWQSQKLTFTCPRCHNSISILKQPEEVKCTKCQRHLEDNWKVCPIDGTKRPEPKDKWRFCPICGKSITVETAWSIPSKFVDYYRLDLPTKIEIEQIDIRSPEYFPGLMDELESDEHHYVPVPAEAPDEVPAPVTGPRPELLLTQ